MQKLDACLACGGSDLFQYLDLGEQPLANSFHDGTCDLQKFPLAVQACRTCWHSQLTVAVEPSLMFDDYLYVDGTRTTLRQYFADFARRFPGGVRVLDIQGNWLQEIAEKAAPTGKFDIITAFNVIARTSDPLTFLKLAKEALAPGGTIWVQTAQVHTINDGTFDAIHHEHVSYFTPRSMLELGRRAGLAPVAYEEPNIFGGSMLIGFQPSELINATFNRSPLYEEKTYAEFAKRVQQTIGAVKQSGISGPLVGYGAAAKGMTFLNATGLQLERIVDDNPLKHGLLTPGGNIPVGPVVDLPKGEGAVVVLAWDFWAEILERIRRDHGSGHTVIRWFPKFEMVMS